MTSRTIPSLFPRTRDNELFSRKLFTSSIMRKMAMAQNWIWSKAIRQYANHGYEGLGNKLFHYGTPFFQNDDVLEATPDGFNSLPLCSFVVPPNWGHSKRLKIQARVNFADTGSSDFTLIAVLFDMDEVYAGRYVSFNDDTTGDSDVVLSLVVPQTKMYQVKIYVRLTDGNASAENQTTDQIVVQNISARYDAATVEDLGNETPQATYAPIADEAFAIDYAIHAGLLQRLNRNINHLMSYRGAELCQTWLGQHYNNTSSFVEIGRYVVYLPDMVTEIKGKLQCWCTHSGAGNEIRIKVDGSVKETFTTLAAGESTQTLAAITGLSSNAEHTITIEAKSTAASADWGTICNLVSIWESALTMNLPSGSSVASNFQPVDEDGLRGDDPISAGQNAKGQENGLLKMIQNDRWLAANRLRVLVGDWRHRTYKRAGLYDSVSEVDARVDWTRGPESVDHQIGRMKNITINGVSATENDQDSIGTFPYGEDTADYSIPPPFIYPSSLSYTRHGRRLAKHYLVRPTSVRTHMKELGNWIAITRGRRLRTHILSMDTVSGWGTAPEEPPFVDKSYFLPLYNSSTSNNIMIKTKVHAKDYERHWCDPIRGSHTDADNTFTIRGRTPPQMGLSAGQGLTRPEGMLFEVELNSLYLADEPLNEEVLRAL